MWRVGDVVILRLCYDANALLLGVHIDDDNSLLLKGTSLEQRKEYSKFQVYEIDLYTRLRRNRKAKTSPCRSHIQQVYFFL